jgi:hypothetical protein
MCCLVILSATKLTADEGIAIRQTTITKEANKTIINMGVNDHEYFLIGEFHDNSKVSPIEGLYFPNPSKAIETSLNISIKAVPEGNSHMFEMSIGAFSKRLPKLGGLFRIREYALNNGKEIFPIRCIKLPLKAFGVETYIIPYHTLSEHPVCILIAISKFKESIKTLIDLKTDKPTRFPSQAQELFITPKWFKQPKN